MIEHHSDFIFSVDAKSIIIVGALVIVAAVVIFVIIKLCKRKNH